MPPAFGNFQRVRTNLENEDQREGFSFAVIGDTRGHGTFGYGTLERMGELSGNIDVLQTLKNTALARYQNFYNKTKVSLPGDVICSDIISECSTREFATYLQQFDGYQPNIIRGNCSLFTTDYTRIPKGFFFGYWSEHGIPLFTNDSIEKIYKKYK